MIILRYFLKVLPLMFLGALLERLYNQSDYMCRPKSFILIVFNYADLAFMFAVFNMHMGSLRASKYRLIAGTIGVFSVIFFIAVNLFSFTWFIEEFMDPKKCMRRLDRVFLWMIFVVMLALLVCAFILMIILCVQRRHNNQMNRFNHFQRDPEIVKKELIRRNLNSIYLHLRTDSRGQVETFMTDPDTSNLMIKLPALTMEMKLFNENFVQELDPLTITKMRDNDEGTCVVCFVEFQECEKLMVFDCSHCFHQKCVVEWFKIKVSCPCCRANSRHSLVKKLLKKGKTVNFH